MRNESNVFRRTFTVQNNGKQTSGLPPVVRFVPFGCSSRLKKASVPQFTRQHSASQPGKRAGSHYASSSSSSHTHFLRSSGLLRPQYRFITFRCAALHSAVCASTAPCVLAVALPPAINLNRNANADFIDLFR